MGNVLDDVVALVGVLVAAVKVFEAVLDVGAAFLFEAGADYVFARGDKDANDLSWV